MNRKKIRALICLLLILVLPWTAMAEGTEKNWADEARERVPEALEMLLAYCSTYRMITGEGRIGPRRETLDIRGCRLVRLAPEKTVGTPLEQVDYVIEFLCLVDCLGSEYTLYSSSAAVPTEVWVYQDGHMEMPGVSLVIYILNRRLFDLPVDVVDLGTEYNQVVSFAEKERAE